MKTNELKPEEDAFGREIWAYHNGKEIYEITERDDGYFSAHQSPRVYFSEYKDWPAIEKKAMEFVKGRVLDVGCGAGRHSLYLQEKGFDVLGIDISPLAIKVSRLRGLRKAKVMSIKDLNFKPNSFDAIIMMGGNFGLLGGLKNGRRTLKKLGKITSDNAAIIAETHDPYKTDNLLHLEYHKQNKKKGKMSGEMKIRFAEKLKSVTVTIFTIENIETSNSL